VAHLIEELGIGRTALTVKFQKTVRVSSITDDKFTLYLDSATPVETTAPFESIQVSGDYNTISRTLTLHLTDELIPETAYIFKVSGLQDAIGGTIPDEAVSFTTGSEAGDITPSEPSSPTTPVTPTDDSASDGGGGAGDIEVVDYSIDGTEIFDDALVDEFRIVSTDPSLAEPIITPSYANGRVTITFSERPASTYVNTTYFKAQRKPLQREYSRWEDVNVQVSSDTVNPKVYVDFPSTDATPVYRTAGREYFPINYKFRVRASKDIDVAAAPELPNTQGKLDLLIEQGATFTKSLTLVQSNGSPRDLTGYTARMQIRTALTGPVVLELSTENGGIIIEELAGKIHLEITAGQTAALTIRSGVYDLEMVAPGATPTVTRLLSGKVTVSPEVTR
jgi:hypothetical protein